MFCPQVNIWLFITSNTIQISIQAMRISGRSAGSNVEGLGFTWIGKIGAGRS
jgi:hypothetical protein